MPIIFHRSRQPGPPPLLYYRSYGAADAPVVVLLHGFLASSRYWTSLPALLARNYRVVVIDLLGFGDSPKPRRSLYDYDAHLASLRATLEAAGIQQPFRLLGHSMGALLALRYSRLYPERVSRLVLANMPIMLGRKQVRREIMGRNLVYRLGLTRGTDYGMWALFRLASSAQLLPATTKRFMQGPVRYVFQHTARSRWRSFQNVIAEAKVEADLAVIQVQTVLLNGLQDRAIYLQNLTGLLLAEHIRVHSIAGSHHLPHERPELLVQALAPDFLSGDPWPSAQS